MCVNGQVGDYLVCGDRLRYGSGDGSLCDLCCYEVWIASVEGCEEGEDGYLEWRRSVGIEAVISFQDDVAFFAGISAGRCGCCQGGVRESWSIGS